MAREKGNALLAPEAVRIVEYFLIDKIGHAKNFIDSAHLLEAVNTSFDGKYVVLATGLDE